MGFSEPGIWDLRVIWGPSGEGYLEVNLRVNSGHSEVILGPILDPVPGNLIKPASGPYPRPNEGLF